jgi:hypothetical protein
VVTEEFRSEEFRSFPQTLNSNCSTLGLSLEAPPNDELHHGSIPNEAVEEFAQLIRAIAIGPSTKRVWEHFKRRSSAPARREFWDRNLEAARLSGAGIEKAVQEAIAKREDQREQCSPETSFEVEIEKPRILAA